MLSTITFLSAKDIQFLQPYRSLKWAELQLRKAKAIVRTRHLTIGHLADFWGVEPEDLITQLKPRFGVN